MARPEWVVIGLDTNVLLRWLVDETIWPDESAAQVEAARDLILAGGQTFFVNQVVMAETIWVLEHPLAQPKTVVLEIVERLLHAANVVVDGREAIAAAVAGYRAGKPGFTDHLIGHVNRHAGCETTFSFDKDTGRSGVFRRLVARPS